MRYGLQLLTGICVVLLHCPFSGGADPRTAFYRISSSSPTEIVAFSPDSSELSWSNQFYPSDCNIELSHDLSDEWWPISSVSATGTVSVESVPTNRTYYLGFTPLPYDIPEQPEDLETIISNVYRVIEQDGDIVFHHYDNGVPWVEALAGQPYHDNMLADIDDRLARTPDGHKVFLGITPINLARTSLAPYKAAEEDMPLPAPWNGYRFNHADVKTAYLNYCEYMIGRFQPDYLAIGIEVNLLMANEPDKWSDYRELHQYIYASLKNAHPSLPVFVSFAGMELMDGYTEADHANQLSALSDMMPYSDFFGLSLHCFISALLAETVPSRDLLRQIFSLSDKPLAICETSYPAEVFSIDNGSLIFNGSLGKQQLFYENLFSALESYPCEFINNFIPIDYDGLWRWMGEPDDAQKLWRDTGLYDHNLQPRPALRTWKGKQLLPVIRN